MKHDVHRFIGRHQLITPGETIIVAVSGGPDSIALLDFLWKERTRYLIDVRACHVHHQLRDIEADEDEAYIYQFCQERRIPLYSKRVDVKKYAASSGEGTQVAARKLRYEWFSELLADIPNSKLATGHHGDDQTETVLMQMIRGGLPLRAYGIPVMRKLGDGVVIRPFLGITKEMIEHYCKQHRLNARFDSSNHARTYTRNRIRQDVLPVLKRENQQLHTHMQRWHEWMDDDQRMLQKLAEESLSSVMIGKSERNVTISCEALLSVALPLQRRLIHLILNYLYGKNSPSITSIHIEQILELMIQDKTTWEYHLSRSCIVRREYDFCHFSTAQGNTLEEQEHILPVPGRVEFGGWVIEAYITEDATFTEAENEIVLDKEALTEPLIIRKRQSSDRIACRGMEGTKKVGRLFIDRKIPRQERESWPILVDGNGEVLWVPYLHRTRMAQVVDDSQCRRVVVCCRQGKMKADLTDSSD
ncbi:tRNA lysidine(34) synthetase TilS [Alkalihalobacillus oceani]|uniref:tRNA lysidine(34) synthetase TilS n=1 Tax=Halalkalibacter oceani TaxID=1653776 RepID=UPI00203E535D|nr:tRNA lysidine(34) synthetase TilS [Halalkalibacter oceani]MCM3762569.1 tRNA lysidine(34) synthetase TilS [Halalkalibacter oceani]